MLYELLEVKMKRILIAANLLLCFFALAISLVSANGELPFGTCYKIVYPGDGTCSCVPVGRNGTGYCQCDDLLIYSCQFTGASCFYNGPPSQCDGSRPFVNSIAQSFKLSADPVTIEQIAAVHPRFALTLVLLAKKSITAPSTLGLGQFVWSPIKFKAEDVKYFLTSNRAESKEMLAKLWANSKEEASKLKEESPSDFKGIRYLYFTEYEPNSNSATLRIINTTPSIYDPLINKLTVRLEQSNNGTTTEWRIKDWAVDSSVKNIVPGQEPLNGTLMLDAVTMKQIAAAHPRFAATLAIIARSTTTKTNALAYGQFVWSPVPISAGDIKYFLNPTTAESKEFSAELLAKSKEQARKLKEEDPNETVEIVYPYFTEYDPGSNSATLRIVNSTPTIYDPPQTIGLIHLEKSNSGVPEWRIKDWAIY